MINITYLILSWGGQIIGLNELVAKNISKPLFSRYGQIFFLHLAPLYKKLVIWL